MDDNPFDKACRYLAKLDPIGILAWLLGIALDQFVFRRWLDTRLITFPGQPDRTCDTVAHVDDVQRGLLPWAMVLEFQIEPDAEMFGRAMGYAGQLWLEVRPGEERGDRFAVGVVILNLTGVGNSGRNYAWRGAGIQTGLKPGERNLSKMKAGKILAGIEAGNVSRVVLPFIPLMLGGGKPGIIKEWLRLATLEPDDRRRSDYGALALVFAEKSENPGLWDEALKGWNMVQSTHVLEWQAEARAETRVQERKEMLLEILAAKFTEAPQDLVEQINAETDPATLKKWVRQVVQAPSLDDLRKALRNGSG